MKKLLFIFLAGVLSCCISCNGDKTDAKGGMSADAEKNLAAVHGINKCIESGDVSKLGDFIAADAIDHTGEHGEIKGLDSIKAALTGVHEMSTDMKTEILKEFADDNTVIQWVRYTGTCSKPMGGMAVGTHFDMASVHVSKHKDGKATDHWEFMTMGDMVKMMPNPMDMPKMDKMDNKMDTSHKK